MPDLREKLSLYLADRYRVEGELGHGGMAYVFAAQDLKHERPVALKVLRPELTGGQEPERFLREIRTVASLAHPNILPLHDSGELEGLLYYVMPYVAESLRQRLEREGRLPVAEALRIVEGIGGALGYAHARGVLHRDIKPENILLQSGEPLVSDFGIARMISQYCDNITDQGIAVGTPTYMSPEQASADRDLDGRSDVYSLACVLYEMLAGQPPFIGPSARAIMARHVTDPVPPVRILRPDTPPAVAAALTRALEKDPAHRFPTPMAFIAALQQQEGAPTARRRRTIAVLPFTDTGGTSDLEYFSDGMTDELITALTRVKGLEVASRTSVFAWKGNNQDVRAIGARLGVLAVIEGTVRMAGDRLRVTVGLTDVTDGRMLWSERFDRTLEDVFAVQDEITHTVVETLRTRFVEDLDPPVPERYTNNVKAYSLYLKGRFHWNRRGQEGITEAIRHFEAALAEDPTYALAHTGLADAYALQIDYRGVPVAEGLERARAEAGRALELDDNLAEAHTSLGWVLFIYDWDWEGAEREFQRAIELNPRYTVARQWHAWPFAAMGRLGEAIAESELSTELDPASVSARRSLGWLYYYDRQYGEAIRQLDRALIMDPTSEETRRIIGLAQMQAGSLEEAGRSLREAAALSLNPDYARAALGTLEARRGNPEATRSILAELEAAGRERYVSPVALTMLHVAVGDKDAAFAGLEQCHSERRGWMAYLRIEPALDSLRSDPRFHELMTRMRLA